MSLTWKNNVFFLFRFSFFVGKNIFKNIFKDTPASWVIDLYFPKIVIKPREIPAFVWRKSTLDFIPTQIKGFNVI